MLQHCRDLHTLAYMAAATAVVVIQWQLETFSPALYALQLTLAFAVSIMNHNHRHLPMWCNRHLNRATDYWFAAYQGHPGFVLNLFHNNNHHRHCNGAADYTRVYRHRDDNNALGFLLHPFESLVTLAPIIRDFLRDRRKRAPRAYRTIMNEYLFIAGCLVGGFVMDWQNALIYIVIPQLFALFWLLGANYLQHAHTGEHDPWLASRNFLGWVNPLFFNIGLHTAHHIDGRAHWSELPFIHRQIQDRIDPKLIEPSLLWYFVRVFALSITITRFQSVSRRLPPRT